MCIRDRVRSAPVRPMGALVRARRLACGGGVVVDRLHGRDNAVRDVRVYQAPLLVDGGGDAGDPVAVGDDPGGGRVEAVSYTHLRAHETPEHLVCRLLLEK